jgi:hypothetical protein
VDGNLTLLYSLVYGLVIVSNCITGMTNLWHAIRFLWYAAFTPVPNLFVPVARPASLYCEEYMYVYISDAVGTVYALALLPTNTAGETFLNKSGAVRSVDRILSLGCRLGECVTLDRMFTILFSNRKW